MTHLAVMGTHLPHPPIHPLPRVRTFNKEGGTMTTIFQILRQPGVYFLALAPWGRLFSHPGLTPEAISLPQVPPEAYSLPQGPPGAFFSPPEAIFLPPGCLWRLFFSPCFCLRPHHLRPPPPPRHIPTAPPTPHLQGVALGVCLGGYICGWGGLLEVPSSDLVRLENHYPLIYAIWHNFTWQGETLICPRSHNGA